MRPLGAPRYRSPVDGYVMRPAAAALACAAALGLLALLVYGADAFRHADLRAFIELSAHHHSSGGGLAEAIAVLGDPLPLVGFLAVACAIALLRGRPRDALAATLVVAGANITTQGLKAVLAHPRAQTLLGGSGSAAVGFPSGHTTAACSIGIAFALVVPRNLAPIVLALGAAFGLAVGLSVVVIAWHYPSDVIGGILVAAGWGFAVLAARRAAWPREPRGAGFSAPGSLPSR
jgi:membrane-associated phospholipid phosphatase